MFVNNTTSQYSRHLLCTELYYSSHKQRLRSIEIKRRHISSSAVYSEAFLTQGDVPSDKQLSQRRKQTHYTSASSCTGAVARRGHGTARKQTHLSHEALVVAVLVVPREHVGRELLHLADDNAITLLLQSQAEQRQHVPAFPQQHGKYLALECAATILERRASGARIPHHRADTKARLHRASS